MLVSKSFIGIKIFKSFFVYLLAVATVGTGVILLHLCFPKRVESKEVQTISIESREVQTVSIESKEVQTDTENVIPPVERELFSKEKNSTKSNALCQKCCLLCLKPLKKTGTSNCNLCKDCLEYYKEHKKEIDTPADFPPVSSNDEGDGMGNNFTPIKGCKKVLREKVKLTPIDPLRLSDNGSLVSRCIPMKMVRETLTKKLMSISRKELKIEDVLGIVKEAVEKDQTDAPKIAQSYMALIWFYGNRIKENRRYTKGHEVFVANGNLESLIDGQISCIMMRALETRLKIVIGLGITDKKLSDIYKYKTIEQSDKDTLSMIIYESALGYPAFFTEDQARTYENLMPSGCFRITPILMKDSGGKTACWIVESN